LKSLHLIYFSPTGTTRKVLEAIGRGLAAEQIERLDLTSRETRAGGIREIKADFAIIGTPVYTGRVPLYAVEALQSIRAENIPAIVVVVYGNRAYEDALLELTDTAKNAGFTPVAAASFVGEHSFSTDAAPIARGRPDREDLEEARAFGEMVRDRIGKGLSHHEDAPLEVPGNFPYRDRNPSPPPPHTDAGYCMKCGRCADVCPTAAITLKDETVVTETTKCISCCACVKNCPSGARRVDPVLAERAKKIGAACSDRKKPELFTL